MENSPGSAPSLPWATSQDPSGAGTASPAQGAMFSTLWLWKCLMTLFGGTGGGRSVLCSFWELPGSRQCPSSSGRREGAVWEAASPRHTVQGRDRGGASMVGQNAAPATPNNFALVTDDSDVLMEGSAGWLRLQLAFPAVPGLGSVFRHGDSHPELPWPGGASSGCIPAAFQLFSSCFPAACLSMAWGRVTSAAPWPWGGAGQGAAPPCPQRPR